MNVNMCEHEIETKNVMEIKMREPTKTTINKIKRHF